MLYIVLLHLSMVLMDSKSGVVSDAKSFPEISVQDPSEILTGKNASFPKISREKSLTSGDEFTSDIFGDSNVIFLTQFIYFFTRKFFIHGYT